MVRLDLPPPTLDASLPDLSDIRLLSPSGVETPYLLEWLARSRSREQDAEGFKAEMRERSTVLVVTGTKEPVDAVILRSPSREFLKSATLEGSHDGSVWQELANREVIFRQPGGAERLRIPFLPAVWEQLRFTIDDGRTKPVAFTGVRLALAAGKSAVLDHPVRVGQPVETPGETSLALDLGAANLDLAGIRLDISDAVFCRSYVLGIRVISPDGTSRVSNIAEGSLYRVRGEQEVFADQLVIPLNQRISSRSLVLQIRNGDSPPLAVKGAVASRHPTTLAFFAPQPGEWRLLVGNRRASMPSYDLAPLRGALARAGGQRFSPGPLRAKPDFHAPPALPGIDSAGAPIDVTNWGRRRAVKYQGAEAVIRVEFDAPILANARYGLGDIRFVQNGKQIPYLVESAAVSREIHPEVTPLPDPRRPKVSRWQVRMPVANLPAAELLARSPSPLFTRDFTACAVRRDEFGNPWTQVMGSATWTKSGSARDADARLALGLSGERLPESLILETDNGDNPPILLEDVVIRYAAPVFALKPSGSAPLFLYYGNPRADAPSYDLRLARADLLSADKQAATLGEEEILRADPGPPGEISAGSPWLWAALGMVVVVLLFVVAKLLPRGDGNGAATG
jgi:hypothetical protein